VRATFLLLAVHISGCYDIDALRAGRDTPADGAPDDAGTPGDEGGADVVTSADGGDAAPVCPVSGPLNGLLAYYPFDEGSGLRVDDCSGHRYDGFILAPSAQWIQGHQGGALRITATSGCVQVAPGSVFDFTGAFSVAAWINVASFPASSSSAGYIVGKTRDPDLAGWRLGTGQPGGVGGTIALPSGSRLSVSTPVSSGVWLHVAFVVTPGKSAEVYVNGVVQGSQGGVPSSLVPDPAANARFGCRTDDTQAFDGALDELYIYNRPLTLQEVGILAR
jgi:hypothetical protein